MTTQTPDSTLAKPNILIRKRGSGVAFMILDAGGKTNVLSSLVMDEFKEAIKAVDEDDSIKAVCIVSGKAESFITGADLHEIMKFTDAAQARELSARGQIVFNSLANLSKPTVVGINGVCLGGGLELALCCTERIATDVRETLIGLPETKLGFVPGLGGTQRLPRLIGVRNALEIILAGDPVSAARAHEMGIIDSLTTPDQLFDQVEAAALRLITQWQKEGRTKSDANSCKDELPPEKLKSLFAMAERSVRIRTKGNYPAQTKVLEVMKLGLKEGLEAGLAMEANVFGELSVTDVSRNLVFLVFTSEFARQSAIATGNKGNTPKTKTVAVIGAGLMGSTIAQLAAEKGFDVLLASVNENRSARAKQIVGEIAARIDKLKAEAGTEKKQVFGTIAALSGDNELQKADLVIEAGAEDAEVKKHILSRISQAIRPQTLIATNTSSLSVTDMAKGLPEGTQLIGMHFFHPVDKMPLVEVITPVGTTRGASAQAVSFLARLGKTPQTVKDSPCFLVNRLLTCYIVEATRVIASGVPVNFVEEAAVSFGMPMGPMALMDEVGLDVANMVAISVFKAFGERMTPPPQLQIALEAGMIGKKTRVGLYLFDESEKRLGLNPLLVEKLKFVITDAKVDKDEAEALARRMILPMVDEAARCLDEKVVRRAREIDLCMVMGMGFPPFRGGLLRYADALGINNVIEELEKIYEKSSVKREVSTFLRKLAAENRSFYARSQDEI
jgi:3-hydroxyacyl-CoA dehydrogenase/enoyl-CoA hydratase/3-hydroxybutyryl-CoA epimerase